MLRTHTCGALNTSHIGQTVTLAGWIHKTRDLGGLIFLDLRDRYGITQITVDPAIAEQAIVNTASSLKHEYVVQITGNVIARPANMINKNMETGSIELEVSTLTILTRSKELPFNLGDDPKTSEENRMKHRYLDLRRAPILRNIKFRAQMNHFTRNRFTDEGFLEVQTPIFSVSSPEGARDYLIPSRVNPGQFYALPQAPQQYKQLLMVGGVDKYFQIAPCFRDEDPRADRHMCEFYQIDCEMSFVEQEDIYKVVESYCRDLTSKLVPHKTIKQSFHRLSHHDALDLYGSDKPDLRFGCTFIEMTEVFTDSGFSVFADTVASGGSIKAIKLDQETLSRKDIDKLTTVARLAGAKGLAYIRHTDEGLQSPITKFFDPQTLQTIKDLTQSVSGDIIFFISDSYDVVIKALNKLRLHLRDLYNLADKNELCFVWIEDFPFFEMNDEGTLDFAHNPFSYIKGGAEALANKPPLELETTQYDLALNGYEILSGSIRNYDPVVMVKAFEKAGLTENDIKAKFGAMYNAFEYGAPPHGGFAIGFDRLMMILLDQDNIRDIYAFPKSGRAQDLMMGAPSTAVDPAQLEELHIQVVDTEEE